MHPWHQSANASAPWRKYLYGIIGAEVSSITRYCTRLIQWEPRRVDTGALFEQIACPQKQVAGRESLWPQVERPDLQRTAILVNGNFNYDLDIQATLTEIRSRIARHDRIVLIAYNSYLKLLYKVASRLGLREGDQPDTFLTRVDLENISRLAGFEITRNRFCGYCPLSLGGIGPVLNRICPTIPFLRWIGLTCVITLRPVVPAETKPSLSVIIPARNEKGNIENALVRMPSFSGADIEVIFVEGHSTDGTWEEIQRVIQKHKQHITVSAYQQSGIGKVDAVRLGFSEAKGDLLTILDADLTMPPELLERFYNAYCSGLADFINGTRILYPMEGQAMKFLNRLGNVFFAKALSLVLGVRIGDSLCGTKLFSRVDYERMRNWRNDFGDFDPFGDFELLFPASILGLGIIDVPVRYRDRVYGTTNIRRFYHGAMLLKMTLLGFFRISLGRVK